MDQSPIAVCFGDVGDGHNGFVTTTPVRFCIVQSHTHWSRATTGLKTNQTHKCSKLENWHAKQNGKREKEKALVMPAGGQMQCKPSPPHANQQTPTTANTYADQQPNDPTSQANPTHPTDQPKKLKVEPIVESAVVSRAYFHCVTQGPYGWASVGGGSACCTLTRALGSRSCFHTYIPTYLPTYLHSYIPTYLPITT